MASLASILAGFNNPGALTVTGANNYAGQTGVYAAPNGLNYAQFASQAAGAAGVTSWLNNNTGTDPLSSYTTIGEAGNAYTGSTTGGAQWAAILGLPASYPVSGVSQSALANAAIKNEGISSTAAAPANSASPLGSGAPGFFTDPLGSISSWIASGAVEVIFIILGLLLIGGAVFMFAKSEGVLDNVPIPV